MSTRRNLLKMAAALPAAAAIGTALPAAAQQAKRTYVLVHGAWHGGWCWVHVADRLRAAGHNVFTPTLTGVGERKHLIGDTPAPDLETNAIDIMNVLEAEELTDVYLVAHSFGGQAASIAVDRIPQKIKRFILLDAGWPTNGVAVFDTLPGDMKQQRLKLVQEQGKGIQIPVPDASTFGVTDPQQAAWVNRRLTPQPVGTYASPAKFVNPPGNGRPVTFIRCVNPRYVPVNQYEDYAHTQKDWQFLTVDCGHDAMVMKPAELAELLLGVA